MTRLLYISLIILCFSTPIKEDGVPKDGTFDYLTLRYYKLHD